MPIASNGTPQSLMPMQARCLSVRAEADKMAQLEMDCYYGGVPLLGKKVNQYLHNAMDSLNPSLAGFPEFSPFTQSPIQQLSHACHGPAMHRKLSVSQAVLFLPVSQKAPSEHLNCQRRIKQWLLGFVVSYCF